MVGAVKATKTKGSIFDEQQKGNATEFTGSGRNSFIVSSYNVIRQIECEINTQRRFIFLLRLQSLEPKIILNKCENLQAVCPGDIEDTLWKGMHSSCCLIVQRTHQEHIWHIYSYTPEREKQTSPTTDEFENF